MEIDESSEVQVKQQALDFALAIAMSTCWCEIWVAWSTARLEKISSVACRRMQQPLQSG